MSRLWVKVAVIAALAALSMACQEATVPVPAGAVDPSGAAAQLPAEAAVQEPIDQLPASGLPGVVIEAHHAGGYTYVKVRTGSGDLWAATALAKVKAGDNVVVPRGNKMVNFQSKALGRTFEQIFFVDHLKGAEAVNGAPSSAPSSAPASAPASATGEEAAGVNPHDEKAVSPGAGVPNPQVEVDGLSKPEGGQTIEEIFAGRAALSGKVVKLRGRVVKVNNQIMGRNWIHIQDGTGQSQSGTHDLTVTTAAEVSVGSTALVEGTLVLNKDFGAGYKFALIIEDAKVTPEP